MTIYIHEATRSGVRCSCRSDPTGNCGASGPRRGLGVRPCRPLLADAAHDFLAPEGAGIGGADLAPPRGPTAALQTGAGTTEGRHRLARGGPRDLGRELQATRCVTRRIEAS